jgi:basic amino acid/polyamine antiporter, APA family
MRPGAGPSLIVSFIIAAIICGFTALCYAEFASAVPASGSAYVYSYVSMGEIVAWIIGWTLVIEYALGNVAVAISWSNYFRTFLSGFGIFIPDWAASDLQSAMANPELIESAPHIFGIPVVFNLLAGVIIAAITIILIIGIKESVRANAVMVLIKLAVLGLFTLVGLSFVRPENWTPFAPNGLSGIQSGAAVIFFAYMGFDALSTVGEEVKNPKRDLPLGMIGSLVICTLIYIVIAVVFTGLVPYSDLIDKFSSSQAEPLTLALRYVDIGQWDNTLIGIVALGAIAAQFTAILAFQLAMPRILFSMSRDGLLPGVFSKVHSKYQTPHISTIFAGIAVGLPAMFVSLQDMIDLTNVMTLFIFIVVSLGIIIMRRVEPDMPRSFKTPLVPWIPIASILGCLYLMFGLPWTAWAGFVSWVVLGLIVYFAYGYRKSRLNSTGH